MPIVGSVLLSLRSLIRSRAALHLEILALRHQLKVLERSLHHDTGWNGSRRDFLRSTPVRKERTFARVARVEDERCCPPFSNPVQLAANRLQFRSQAQLMVAKKPVNKREPNR